MLSFLKKYSKLAIKIVFKELKETMYKGKKENMTKWLTKWTLNEEINVSFYKYERGILELKSIT